MRFRWLLLVPLAMSLGCANYYKIPRSRVIAPVASIKAAQELGASRDPQAAALVATAQRELQMAHKYAQQGQGPQADLMFQRANADAELAMAITRQRQELERAQASIAELQSLSQRGGTAVTAPQPGTPVAPAPPPPQTQPPRPAPPPRGPAPQPPLEPQP